MKKTRQATLHVRGLFSVFSQEAIEQATSHLLVIIGDDHIVINTGDRIYRANIVGYEMAPTAVPPPTSIRDRVRGTVKE